MQLHHGLSELQSRLSTDVLPSVDSSSARYPVSSLEQFELEEEGELVWLSLPSVSDKPSEKNGALWEVLEDIQIGVERKLLKYFA
jgi:hypothetical protein